ncbi:MAG: phage major tail tube protein [Allobaculum sp.]|nr:phage major tail tube protein [Allobaculum sp.]
MQSNFNFGGPILADTTYIDGIRIQRNVKFSLPTFTMVTAEIQAMGKHEKPLRGYFEAAEHKLYFDRLDDSVAIAFEPKRSTVEHRWVQVEISPDGTEKDIPYKAFVTGEPKVAFPGGDQEPGNVPEFECPWSVDSLKIYREGKEFFVIERYNDAYRVNGKDYYRDIDQYL